jgi:hypothetical protein
MSGEHTNDSHIIITKNIQKFKDFDWIHNNTIFNTLTNEHFVKLIFLQKIKVASNHDTKIHIYIDNNIDIETFNLHPKLLNIARTKNIYNIIFKSTNDIIKKDLNEYKLHINDFSR